MKKNIIFYLVFSLSNCIYGQVLKPFQFNNYKPQWYHIVHSSKIPETVFQYEFDQLYLGFNPPLIRNNKLHILSNIFDAYYSGYILECIDLKTGKEIWEKSNYSTEVNKRQFAVNPTFINDSLSLIIIKEKFLNNFYPIWGIGDIGIYYLNNSGNIIDSIPSMNVQTPLSRNASIPYVYNLENSSSIQYYINNYNIESVGKFVYNRGAHKGQASFRRAIINSKQEFIDSTEIFIDLDYNGKYLRNYNLENNTILTSLLGQNSEDSASHYLIVHSSRDLSYINTMDISAYVKPMEFPFLNFADSTHFLITIFKSIRVGLGFIYIPDRLELFSIKGLHISSYDVSNLVGKNENNGINATFYYQGKNLKVLIAEGFIKDSISEFNFYETDTLGLLSLTRNLKVEGKNNQAFLSKMDVINNNIICGFTYRNIEYGFDSLPVITQWVSMPLSDFISTSNNTSLISNSSIRIFPNPIHSGNNLNLNIPIGSEIRYSIIDMLGKVITSNKIIYNSNGINVDNLSCGEYVLKLQVDNKSSSNVFQIIE